MALNQLQTISTLLQQESSRRKDTLPPAGELNANAQPMHSLLTTLLPHLAGESAQLGSTINWAQPLSRPENRAAFSTNVKEYQLVLPNRSQSTATLPESYPVASYAANQDAFHLNRPLPLKALVDGTGNTVFCGQVTVSLGRSFQSS